MIYQVHIYSQLALESIQTLHLFKGMSAFYFPSYELRPQEHTSNQITAVKLLSNQAIYTYFLCPHNNMVAAYHVCPQEILPLQKHLSRTKKQHMSLANYIMAAVGSFTSCNK